MLEAELQEMERLAETRKKPFDSVREVFVEGK